MAPELADGRGVDGNLFGTTVDGDARVDGFDSGIHLWGGTDVQIGTSGVGNVFGGDSTYNLSIFGLKN